MGDLTCLFRDSSYPYAYDVEASAYVNLLNPHFSYDSVWIDTDSHSMGIAKVAFVDDYLQLMACSSGSLAWG